MKIYYILKNVQMMILNFFMKFLDNLLNTHKKKILFRNFIKKNKINIH